MQLLERDAPLLEGRSAGRHSTATLQFCEVCFISVARFDITPFADVYILLWRRAEELPFVQLFIERSLYHLSSCFLDSVVWSRRSWLCLLHSVGRLHPCWRRTEIRSFKVTFTPTVQLSTVTTSCMCTKCPSPHEFPLVKLYFFFRTSLCSLPAGVGFIWDDVLWAVQAWDEREVCASLFPGSTDPVAALSRCRLCSCEVKSSIWMPIGAENNFCWRSGCVVFSFSAHSKNCCTEC